MNDDTTTSVEAGTVLTRHADYEYQDGFLVNTARANDAVYVNATALMVWGMCDGETTVGEISTHLEQAYPETGSQVNDDVMQAASRLLTHGVVFLSS